MSRPRKQTVDYFPHYCTHGKTMFILEERFGNNGYAFWFKLLEVLGNSNGHFVDCNDISSWQFLVSITHTTEVSATEMLTLLSKLNAIDSLLWDKKIIWCQNFVDGVKDAYTKRTAEVPKKPVYSDINPNTSGFPTPETNHKEISVTDNPQIKVKETKVNKTKVNKTKENKGMVFEIASICNFSNDFNPQWQRWKDYKKEQVGFKFKSVDSEQTAFKHLLELSANNEEIAIKIINQSIAKGWKGLFELSKNSSITQKATEPDKNWEGTGNL